MDEVVVVVAVVVLSVEVLGVEVNVVDVGFWNFLKRLESKRNGKQFFDLLQNYNYYLTG